jgi:hypothetical protein
MDYEQMIQADLLKSKWEDFRDGLIKRGHLAADAKAKASGNYEMKRAFYAGAAAMVYAYLCDDMRQQGKQESRRKAAFHAGASALYLTLSDHDFENGVERQMIDFWQCAATGYVPSKFWRDDVNSQ